MLDFYERIEILLKKKKLTQKDLCKNVDLASAQIFTNWKLRNSIPSADIALKIAKYLDTTVEYLVTGIETNEYKNKYENLKSSMQRIITEN